MSLELIIVGKNSLIEYDWSNKPLTNFQLVRVVLSTRKNLEGLGTSLTQNGAGRKIE